MTARDDLRAARALQGKDFPATKSELIDYVQSRGGDDQKTMNALEMLPDQQFPNHDAVIDAVPQEPEGADQPGGSARWMNENPEEKS
jgi:hypothetical protein